MTTDAALSEAQAAVYDRQLRIWGVETQKRLSSSRVLIYGLDGLAAEVAKNIVLAGVGSVTLVDDRPANQAPPGNFLVAAHAASGSDSVASASMATLQEMNPFVKMSTLAGDLDAVLQPDALRQVDLLLLSGQAAPAVQRADEACSQHGVGLFAARSRGIFGWLFANLHQHQYAVETETQQPDGTTSKSTSSHSSSYPAWHEAMACDLAGINMRRTSKLYFVLRACAALEQAAQRAVGAPDADELLKLVQQLLSEHGFAAAAVDHQMVRAYAAAADDMPAVNAVLGGIAANELVKAVTAKGEPLNNFFFFSLTDGAGIVERFG